MEMNPKRAIPGPGDYELTFVTGVPLPASAASGRKNYLFAGSDAATAARHSLIASAQKWLQPAGLFADVYTPIGNHPA